MCSSDLHTLGNAADLNLIVVGDEASVLPELERRGLDNDPRVKFVHAPQVVEMDEKPSSALRNKRESSMRVAINQVKNGDAQACVSAGNTGALMAIARFVLKTLPGIDRPAICATMPGITQPTHVLDLGANRVRPFGQHRHLVRVFDEERPEIEPAVLDRL